jgi:hypothetical protein
MDPGALRRCAWRAAARSIAVRTCKTDCAFDDVVVQLSPLPPPKDVGAAEAVSP